MKKYPKIESDSLSSIIQDFRMLFSKNKTNYTKNIIHIQRMLSFCKDIFKNESNAEVFAYFCLHGAATAWILQNQLNMSQATVYRVLKLLRAKRIVVPALRAYKLKTSRGGPRATVWALEGAETEEIARALKLHYRMLSPKYRVAEKVAQTILDEYIAKRNITEISYKEIIIQIRELKIPFRTPDIAHLAAQYLNEQGIKVWR